MAHRQGTDTDRAAWSRWLSASRIRELARFGTDVSAFVPALVQERLSQKLGR